MIVWRNNTITEIQLNGTGECLINKMFRFGAIYQIQESPAGNLSNIIAINHANADVTVASKNYSVQSYGCA